MIIDYLITENNLSAAVHFHKIIERDYSFGYLCIAEFTFIHAFGCGRETSTKAKNLLLAEGFIR